MKKIYEDEMFGIMEADEFEPPLQFNIELDCDKYELEHNQGDFDLIDRDI
jgi:hypothetical protein